MAGRSTEVIIEQVFNKILSNKDISIIIDNGLDAEYFPGYEDEYNFLLDYYERYGSVPSTVTFLDAFPEFNIFAVDEPDDYLFDSLFELYTYNKFAKGWAEVRDIISDSPTGALDKLRSILDNLPAQSRVHTTDIIKDAALRLQSLVKKQEDSRGYFIKTGFDELDAEVGGWNRGEEFAVIFGRTGQGKSWILLKTLTEACRSGNRVGLVSPEMSPDRIGYRFDSILNGFSNYKLTSAKILNEEDTLNQYRTYIDSLSQSQDFFMVATPKDFNRRVTVSKLRKWCLQNKLDILAIDGIKYLDDERRKNGDSVSTMLTNISEDLMSLSIELKIPVLACVQANRSGARTEDQDGVPDLENIRDSDGISHSASKVLAIRQREDRLEMQLKKNRDGKTGQMFTYYCNFDEGKFTFESVNTERSSGRSIASRNTKALPSADNSAHEQELQEREQERLKRREKRGKAKDF